jgi:hypothetical protein
VQPADRIRELIAQEAARLMFEDGVKALALGSHLPSNAEIHVQLSRLIEWHEGGVLPERLLRLRQLALKYLELLAPFQPLLVGSVPERGGAGRKRHRPVPVRRRR